MENTFTVVVEKDPESGWLVGKVVELPGCYTQAPDPETLKSNVREAIELYLEVSQPEEPLPSDVETYHLTT